jgi:lysophospholipase L1-like esterase
MIRRTALRIAIVGLLAAIPLRTGASAAENDIANACAAPPALTRIEPALTRAATRIDRAKSVTIVAVGSSSTQGVGASDPSATYPSRLEAALKQRLPGVAIRVINRGKGGEDAEEEFARLGRDVIAEHPDLVIWQVGTNAVLRRDDLESDEVLLRRGVALLKLSGADVVLMDLQYAPRILERRATAAMEQLIAEIAQHAGVGLFRRFAVMQHWRTTQPAGTPAMIGADGLHMSDAGYSCLAAELAKALVANWESHRHAAQPSAEAPGKVATIGTATSVAPPDKHDAH